MNLPQSLPESSVTCSSPGRTGTGARPPGKRAVALALALALGLGSVGCSGAGPAQEPEAPERPGSTSVATPSPPTVLLLPPAGEPDAGANPSGARDARALPEAGSDRFGVRQLVVERSGDIIIHSAYPELSAPAEQLGAAAKALNAEIVTFVQSRVATLDGHDAESRADQARGLLAWSLAIDCQVSLNRLALVGFTCLEQTYTSGAHGNHQSFGRSYVVKEGAIKPLWLEPLFAKPAKALEWLGVRVLADLARQGALSVTDGTIVDGRGVLKEWALGEDGLRFFFAPYSVGPYAQGDFTVVVPYPELAPFLPPRSPLEPLTSVPTAESRAATAEAR